MFNILPLVYIVWNFHFAASYQIPAGDSLGTLLELPAGTSSIQVHSAKQVGNTITNGKMTCEFYDVTAPLKHGKMKLLAKIANVYECDIPANVSPFPFSGVAVQVLNQEKVPVKYTVEVTPVPVHVEADYIPKHTNCFVK